MPKREFSNYEMREDYYNQQQLMERGWSGRMISRLLGKPDEVQPNPYHRSGPMKLFRKVRVLEVERSMTFAQERQIAKVHSTRAKDIAQSKRLEVLETAKSVPITVPKLGPKRLAKDARCYLDDLIGGGGGVDVNNDAPNFKEFLAAKFLYSASYPREVFASRIRGKVGQLEASIELHKRLCDAIAGAYPELSEECQRMAEA